MDASLVPSGGTSHAEAGFSRRANDSNVTDADMDFVKVLS
jgi:hypothetical protein